MSADDDGWGAFLSDKLSSLQIEVDEAILEYVNSIVQIEDEDEDEKREGLTEFMAELTESPTEAAVAAIVASWTARQVSARAADDAEKLQKLKEAEAARQDAVRKEAAAPVEQGARLGGEVSAEQKRLNKALLRQYDEVASGGSDDEDAPDAGVDRTSKPLSKKKEKQARKNATAQDLAMSHTNNNRGSSQQSAMAARDQQTRSSAEKKNVSKQANKDGKAKKEAAKEARRQKTTKGERKG